MHTPATASQPEGWIVLQIDGASHAGRQRDSDNERDTLLRLNGYFPIRAGYWQVMNDWPGVQSRVMEAVSQGRRQPMRRPG